MSKEASLPKKDTQDPIDLDDLERILDESSNKLQEQQILETTISQLDIPAEKNTHVSASFKICEEEVSHDELFPDRLINEDESFNRWKTLRKSR